MEQMLINAAGTLAFGGGGIAIVSYFAFQQFKILCDKYEIMIKRVCESFERALARRDADIETLTTEIRILRSGIRND